MAASSSGEKEKERLGGGLGVASGNSTRERLLSALEDLEVLSRELIEMLAISRNQKLLQAGEENQVNTLNIWQFVAQSFVYCIRRIPVKMRGTSCQKELEEAYLYFLATAVYQAKEKLKSIEKARKGAISSEEIIKYAHRISASNAVCAPLTWVPGDPRRPYPTDLEMRSGLLGQMNNPSTNGVNGHLPGDALAAGRLPDVLAPQYPWQSNDMSMNMLPPNHSSDFLLEPPGHNKENEDDVEIMSTDSSSSSSESD
uniref:Mediator of RNA polymerase II transcription subunit 4 n=1 Tax=Colobus angolensis palliatus TaxID=336983 RepID=A0A2K5ILU3_COLAP